jgi:hypothetical protein
MKFSGDKFQLVRYGRNQEIKENTCYFNGDMEYIIAEVESCRDLGVTIENSAKFDLHIEQVCKKVRQKCGWVLRTFYSRDQQFLRHMFNTLIQPHIDYCSQLWTPEEGPQLDKVEKLLKNFTSKIPAVKELPYWERLRSLKMNSEQRRLERYKVIYTWKILQGMVPNCGIEVSESNERLGRRCKIPKLQKKATPAVQKLRDTSFQVSGPKLFNCLPKWLRNKRSLTIDEFKEKLDSILAKVPDEPRIGGPAGWISNSLLTQMAKRTEGGSYME